MTKMTTWSGKESRFSFFCHHRCNMALFGCHCFDIFNLSFFCYCIFIYNFFKCLFQTLDFGENLLQQIHPTALSGLDRLYGLRLAGNKLRNLTENVFEGVENLKMLNLASNLLQNISKKAFSALKELKVRTEMFQSKIS